MINVQRMSSCKDKAIKEKLQTVSFSLYETVLYLDAHPDCTDAISYYNELMGQLEELTEQYEKSYGPLTIYDNQSNKWEWISSPWPWETEAN